MKDKDWIPAVAELIEAVDTPDLPARLSGLLRAAMPFDYIVIFAYHGDNPPIALHHDFPLERRIIHVDDYQVGPYLLDPFFLASTKPVSEGFYRLKDLAPDRFYQSEYFRGYYIQTSLAEEVGFFVHLPNDVVVVVSLMRKDVVFSAREARELTRLFPIVKAACKQHWKDTAGWFAVPDGAANRPRTEFDMARAFERFGENTLTPRERQVVEYTLKGHSAEAVSQILGIAPGTVRIHRRNIYSKLHIHSQGELFSLFISDLVQ